jgi:hypothetical protein
MKTSSDSAVNAASVSCCGGLAVNYEEAQSRTLCNRCALPTYGVVCLAYGIPVMALHGASHHNCTTVAVVQHTLQLHDAGLILPDPSHGLQQV